MRGKRCSDEFAECLYRFKDDNPNSTLRGISRIFGVAYSSVYEIFSRRIHGTCMQNYNKPGPKFLKYSRCMRRIIQSIRFDPPISFKRPKNEKRFAKSRSNLQRMLTICRLRGKSAVQDEATYQKKMKELAAREDCQLGLTK